MTKYVTSRLGTRSKKITLKQQKSGIILNQTKKTHVNKN